MPISPDRKFVTVTESIHYGKPLGVISYADHLEAFREFKFRFPQTTQTADGMAATGFCYAEIVEYLGRFPESWEPRPSGWTQWAFSHEYAPLFTPEDLVM